MNINELMQGIFSNLNLPKDNTGDENGSNNGLPFPMDADFLNNMIKNLNFEDVLSKMQAGASVSTTNGTASFNRQDNKKDNTEKELTKSNVIEEYDIEKDKLEDTEDDLKLDESVDNIDFSKLDLGDMHLGNLDINNLLSVFNFEKMANMDNTVKKENNDDEFGEYLN